MQSVLVANRRFAMPKSITLPENPAARFFSDTQRAYVLAAYNNCCAACGSTRQKSLELDHWLPFDGFNTLVCNAIVLCGPCNRVKRNRTIDTYFRLAPRQPMPLDMPDRDDRLDDNTDAFKLWCSQTKTAKKASLRFVPLY